MGVNIDNAKHTFGGTDYLPKQWQAVSAPLGPVLVLAGPGAGKTRCLAGRIQYLIEEKHVSPDRICAITFTNKAAEEIQSRLRLSLQSTAELLTLGTIHSLCLRILRAHVQAVGLPNGFGIASDTYQRLLLRRLGKWKHFQQSKALTAFSRYRLQQVPLDPKDHILFVKYEMELHGNRLIDFDEILTLTESLLRDHPDSCSEVQGQWDHLLVDEFQDLDPVQYSILKRLVARHRSLFCVGDDDQSIFSWRGADSGIVEQFRRDFGIAEPIVLDTNHRCSVAIFEAAQKILPQRQEQKSRGIRAVRNSEFPVSVQFFANDRDEQHWLVADIARDLASSGLQRGKYAVLYRKHEIGSRLEAAFIASSIPCQLGVGHSVSDDPLICQVISSLRLILDPDSEVEQQQFARCVLPDNVVDLIAITREEKFTDKLKNFAKRNPGRNAKVCWRLYYQIENLTSLAKNHTTLRSLIEAIMAMGIGKYTSPIDDLVDKLPDPADNPLARLLDQQLNERNLVGGRLFVLPDGGWEIAVQYLLSRVFPNASVEPLYESNATTADDIVLKRSDQDESIGAARPGNLGDGFRDATANLLATMQLADCGRLQKSFTEYVVFDTETTDEDIDQCEVVELAAVRVKDGQIEARFHSLIHCSRSISPKASQIHGYVDADLIGQPSLPDVWSRFRQFVGTSVLVAHNAMKFDVPVLQRLTADWNGLQGLIFYDSLTLSRHLSAGGGHRLIDLAQRFGIETGRSHRALDDTICLAYVFERLQEERLRVARISSLGNWLDAFALMYAVAGIEPVNEIEKALFRSGARRALGRYSHALDFYERLAVDSMNCPTLAIIIERLGGQQLRDQLQRDTPAEDRYPEAYARLEQLLAAAETGDLHTSIRNFLDRLSLSRSSEEGVDPDRVALLTFHATKGLEFSRVYVIGVEDHQLPGYQAMQENKLQDIDESRRLLYVAMTRAEDRLILTACNERDGKSTGGKMFLGELGLLPQPSPSPPYYP